VSQAKKYELLNKWFDTNQGARVARAFSEEIGKIAGHISGKYLLQIGVTGSHDLLENMRFRNKIIISPSLNIYKSNTFTKFEYLPFNDNSIDCILAPFSMELFPNNQNIMAEFNRVLKSKGFIIFLGINPCSLWGICAFLQKIKLLTKFPLKLRSVLNLKKNLITLGYTQIYLNSFYYIPPVDNLKLIYNLEFLNEMGKMVWPYPAAFYCFVTQKCEYGSQLICNETEDIDFVFKSN
jgi:SAM-dependent methyltransferase